MPLVETFATTREAKEFIIGRIVDEAQLEGVPLSAIEKKMLYFSETGWALPDNYEVQEAFDRDYDQAAYEQKIGALIRSVRAHAHRNDSEEARWQQAVQTISQEDHYLLVLIAARDRSPTTSSRQLAVLLVYAFVAACVLLALGYFLLP